MLIPVNAYLPSENGGIEIFVQTNGLHADLILPSKNQIHDGESIFPQKRQLRGLMKYMAVGMTLLVLALVG